MCVYGRKASGVPRSIYYTGRIGSWRTETEKNRTSEGEEYLEILAEGASGVQLMQVGERLTYNKLVDRQSVPWTLSHMFVHTEKGLSSLHFAVSSSCSEEILLMLRSQYGNLGVVKDVIPNRLRPVQISECFPHETQYASKYVLYSVHCFHQRPPKPPAYIAPFWELYAP